MKKKDLSLAIVLFLTLIVMCGVILYADSSPEGDLSSASGSIVINEICTKNNSIIADNDGKHRDYIELYNSGEAISLEGFSINDGKVSAQPYGSTVLGEGEYLLVFLGNEPTGFGLGAAGGDSIQLLDPQGAIVAQATTASLMQDQVMLNVGGVYTLSYDASPGYSNDAEGLSAFRNGSEDLSPKLIISEILIGNEASLPDERGFYSDAIELYNISSESINLRRYCLSDELQQRHQYRLPDTELQPGGRIVVYCDGGNYIGEGGEIHANFSISHGETLSITDSTGAYITALAENLGDDVSQSLAEDGSYVAAAVSLGYENSDAGVAAFAASRINGSAPLVINEVLLSASGLPYEGGFTDVVEILNRSDEKVNTAGWYLTDGGDPYEYALPATELAPGECLVISCTPQTTGFAIGDEENLFLIGPDFRYASTLSCKAGNAGESINLREAGEEFVYAYGEVSLGYPNTAEGAELFRSKKSTPALVISELMSANTRYLMGPYGATADWIELHNSSDETIQLSEYYISDRASDLQRYALPDISIEPGGYCVLLVKDDPTNLNRNYEVLPFNLSSAGEQLYLSHGGYVTDYVFLPELAADEAYGRSGDSMEFSLLASATPGYGNSAAAEKCDAPIALTAQGCYDGVEYLEVELSGEGDIYYTTNSYAPGDSASLYIGPIRIRETTVIRAECRQSGKQNSEILNLCYIINENDSLPVVSIVTDPANLWDPGSGIYVLGPNASDEHPYFGANFWNDWERPACISLFETDGGGFSADCGIKIFGGFTRAMAKKSLSVSFRDIYGCSELAYPLFGEDSFDTYEAFVLRSSGQDSIGARLKDVLVTSIFSEYTDVPVQDYKAVVVYLNGEYWGIHYIREKMNSNYLAAHFNVPDDTLSIVKGGGWASPEYIEFAKYTASHDMTDPEQYEYVSSRMDVDNYIDFLIAEMWIANLDSGNVKYFLSPEGKWTWVLYDTDMSLREYKSNPFISYFIPTQIGAEDTTAKTFAAKMVKNDEFKDKFLSRLAWQINTIWTEENVNARLDELCELIGDDIPKECERWNDTVAAWEERIEIIRTFAANRTEYMLQYCQSYFDLSDREMRSYGFEI